MFEPARQQIFFPPFYGMFATHVFNAGMFLFLGRAEPSWTPVTRVNYVGLLPCTPTRGCQLHKLDQSASNVAAGLVLWQIVNWRTFFMTIWNVVLWRALYFCHSSVGAEGFGDELWRNSCFHMTRFYFRHGWALFEGCRRGPMTNLEFLS